MFDLFKLENSNVYFLQKNGLFAFIGYPFRYLMDFKKNNIKDLNSNWSVSGGNNVCVNYRDK